jgi:pyruvate dehydrogenase E2 component (dihydrolipoamide acetyltransferase)
MPALGADMDAGTIVKWYVAPGDRVHRGDVVATVDTAKADIDVEIFEDGVVSTLIVPPGVKVPVGTVLATIAASAAEQAAVVPAVTAAPPAVAPAPAPVAGDGDRLRASPVARRMAHALGIDLAAVHGTGPQGAIVKADVEGAAAHAPAPAPPLPAPELAPRHRMTSERQEAMRDAIATLMARSKREIPHYYVVTTIDLTAALRFIERENAARPVARRLLPAALLLKAVAAATREVPELNGFWREDGFEAASAAHVAVAISLRGGGIVAPAIHDAAGLTLDELMDALRDLVRRARTGALRGAEMTEATITVTNLGDEGGADAVYGVIYPPQVALVGFGAVRERPLAADGMVGARPSVVATLAADHRASDGHRGALFLKTLDTLLQHPEEL